MKTFPDPYFTANLIDLGLISGHFGNLQKNGGKHNRVAGPTISCDSSGGGGEPSLSTGFSYMFRHLLWSKMPSSHAIGKSRPHSCWKIIFVHFVEFGKHMDQ